MIPGLADQNGVEFIDFRPFRSQFHEEWRELHAVVDGRTHVRLQVPEFYIKLKFETDSGLARYLAVQAREYAREAQR